MLELAIVGAELVKSGILKFIFGVVYTCVLVGNPI